MPFIKYAHICEYARVDPGGTVSIIGIFDTISVPAFPARFPMLHVITNIGGQKGETFAFSTRIADPNGQLVQSVHPVNIHLEQENATVNQINGYIGLIFQVPGEYSLEVLFHETVVHTIPFRVVARPQRPPG